MPHQLVRSREVARNATTHQFEPARAEKLLACELLHRAERKIFQETFGGGTEILKFSFIKL